MEKEKRIIFPGRYQPLHEGHIALIQSALDKGYRAIIAIRDTDIGEENPYTVEQRMAMFKRAFAGAVDLIAIPDFDEIWVGRKVGYKVIQLPADMEKVSATQIRKTLKEEGLL